VAPPVAAARQPDDRVDTLRRRVARGDYHRADLERRIASQAVLMRTLHAEVESERARADALLLNVLPETIAARLKRDSGVIADRLDGVGILFADLVGFTPLSSRTSPQTIVELLNDVFSAVDELALSLGIEKIRTIGDGYLAVAGAPEPHADAPGAIANLALGIRDIVAAQPTPTGEPLAVRIGLNIGPVVGAIVGRNKFHYDVWGDAVNVSARMESAGMPGRIQVTDHFADLLHDRFELECRGEIDVKGKGQLTTWWLEGPL